ncbi:carbohydrate ABC transporter permease [Streptomyces sp. SL13]|uniref:Carbohydrate ABC transporter permease n=1 Tax=Streptantibioticus silvisoli TaxID=2705255 RepID=A0AA90H5G2_9ACTN|nr:carbohydrate ABC transporter permease [Streptantibioticus silvisoli]MDI5962537.1 carbohydrate ABC transporter permease [Streptantibioticus silvisoli]MDI5969170.1 carbohydrate ABC transporter permease [Streptantibioticus silvisoli]
MATATAPVPADRSATGAPAPVRAGRRRPRREPSAERAFTRLCGAVLVVFALLWLLPLAWALATSVRPDGEINTAPTRWFGAHPTLAAYRSVLDAGHIGQWYLNSLITSALTMVITVVVASAAAFALSRVDFRGRRALYWLVLAGAMIPAQVLVVPQFKELNSVHLLNTYWAVILPQLPSAIAVFVFKSFIDGIPGELVDAARADGAGWWTVYARIVMPLTRPAVSAVAVFTFVWSWNNFLWPLLVDTSVSMMTLPVGLATTQDSYGIRYAELMASAVLGGLPLIVLFLFFQRRIVEGIAGTGLK